MWISSSLSTTGMRVWVYNTREYRRDGNSFRDNCILCLCIGMSVSVSVYRLHVCADDKLTRYQGPDLQKKLSDLSHDCLKFVVVLS